MLALELLRRSSGSGQRELSGEPLRSQVIQQLSVFVADIGYIMQPSHGNYDICTQARKTLQTILDTVLAGPVELHQQPANQETMDAQDTQAVPEIDFNDQEWLNNSFDLDFWTNLEDHPLLTFPDMA